MAVLEEPSLYNGKGFIELLLSNNKRRLSLVETGTLPIVWHIAGFTTSLVSLLDSTHSPSI